MMGIVAVIWTLPRAEPAVGFATADGPSWAADASIAIVEVAPQRTLLDGGGMNSTYVLPDGSVLATVTPPEGFDPLLASDAQLAALNFPARPDQPGDLAAWQDVMSTFGSDEPPTGSLTVAASGPTTFLTTTRYGTPWAGYTVGGWNTQSNTYVAVKTVFTVPSNPQTCSSAYALGFWIGLGGTQTSGSNAGHDLVQQGIECGVNTIGTGSTYRAFTEFANDTLPIAFCGYAGWTMTSGRVVYQNMSFQRSTNTAYFYLQDETTGVAHSCSRTPPSSWHYNLSTADWIAEAPTGGSPDFGAITFTDARAELGASSTWVTLGSQGNISRTYDGVSASSYCIGPSAIGADDASFTDSYRAPGDCGFP